MKEEKKKFSTTTILDLVHPVVLMFGGCDGEGEMDGVETLYNVLTNDNARATRFFFFQTT